MFTRAFGWLTLSRRTFQAILKAIDIGSLVATGDACGRISFTLAKELSESNGQTSDFRRFVLDVLREQAGWFRVEGALVKPERITLHHDLGSNWSRFLEGYLQGAYGLESKAKLKLRTGNGFLTVITDPAP